MKHLDILKLPDLNFETIFRLYINLYSYIRETYK